VNAITELREDNPPRHRVPADCFYCSSSVEPDDVHVDGATGELALHRGCAEQFGIRLIRAGATRRRPGRSGLTAVA
jgi:hypothetical protein